MANAAIKSFSEKVIELAKADAAILAVAAAGSAITSETDEFSDLDLVIVTREAIAPDAEKMRAFVARFPGLIAAFTGEHVGERRLLICLYDKPLLHVDFKFLTADELGERVENPVILFERENILSGAYTASEARWPMPDLQWLEDRFWVWVHYAALKLGRGEFYETGDLLSFVRGQVLGPLLALKYGKLPRGVRKLETFLNAEDSTALQATFAPPEKQALARATYEAIVLYRRLRSSLPVTGLMRRVAAEKAAMDYLAQVTGKTND